MRHSTIVRASFVTGALALLAGRAAPAQRIDMPVGYRLTWIGARWTVGARVVDQSGRPTGGAITYRMADPQIASVNARGEVIARRPGRTRVWAVSGKDSASALIMVEQWPAKFAFSPATVRLDALGARQPLRVLASDSAGIPIVGGTSRVSTCRPVNERVVSLVSGEIVANSNGSTYIRCADRGIADSVRVEVQQRAVFATIFNKPDLARRNVGDTFSIRVIARDRMQKDIPDPRPTWASLSPATVSVDPLTGKARAVNGGLAKIVVQVGDIADSTTVAVEGQALFIPQEMKPAASDSVTRAKATVSKEEMLVYENDTTTILYSVTDTLGNPVPRSDIRLRFVDTTIAMRIDSVRLVGRKQGSTQIIASYGTRVDTLNVNVRPRPVGGSVRSDSASGRALEFRPPPAFLDSIPVNQQRRRAVADSITTNPALAATRQNLVVSPTLYTAIAEHFSTTETGITEDRTGAMYGGGATVMLYQRLELGGSLRAGTMSSVEAIGEDLTVTELDLGLGAFPLPSIGLRGGAVMRGEKTTSATRTWFVPKLSLVTRFSFIGGALSSYTVLSLLPKAKFSGLQGTSGSLFSRGGEAGLEFHRRWFTGGVTYYVEHLSFDDNDRRETFSAIRIRAAYNFGR